MSRWQFEVFKFRSTAREIGQVLGIEPPPDCRVANGRITLIFRRQAAARWPEEQQFEYAVRAARAARVVCAEDGRSQLKRAASWATVVILEDATIIGGCAVVARWECVVPAGL